jgi:hypothetical protein
VVGLEAELTEVPSAYPLPPSLGMSVGGVLLAVAIILNQDCNDHTAPSVSQNIEFRRHSSRVTLGCLKVRARVVEDEP